MEERTQEELKRIATAFFNSPVRKQQRELFSKKKKEIKALRLKLHTFLHSLANTEWYNDDLPKIELLKNAQIPLTDEEKSQLLEEKNEISKEYSRLINEFIPYGDRDQAINEAQKIQAFCDAEEHKKPIGLIALENFLRFDPAPSGKELQTLHDRLSENIYSQQEELLVNEKDFQKFDNRIKETLYWQIENIPIDEIESISKTIDCCELLFNYYTGLTNQFFCSFEEICLLEALYKDGKGIWRIDELSECLSEKAREFIGYWTDKVISIKYGKGGGEKSGLVRKEKARPIHEAWQAEANKIWQKHPTWKNKPVAEKIAEKTGENAETIRKNIQKPTS